VTPSAVRAIGRIAWRDIARHRLRSLLVTLLVLLPVAAMVGGIAIYRTITPTPDRSDLATFGRADLIATGTTRADLVSFVPAGSTVEATTSTGGRITLPGSRPTVMLRALDIEGLAAGMLTLVEGAPPKGPDQVAITAGVGKVAGTAIGGTIELEGIGVRQVVGIVENPMFLGDRIVVVDPDAVTLGDEQSATWLVGLPPGVDAESVVAATTDPQTGEQRVPLESRQSARVRGSFGGDSVSPAILVLGSLALLESALIASAAFAVSIRRRQRELGLLAASGASPRQLAGTVIVEAGVLGLIAGLAGVVAGLIGALAITPWLDELTQRRNPALIVDAVGLLAPVGIGFLAAMLAAIVPARTVSRMPVLVALSGRRPSSTPARRTLVVGLAAVAFAATMTVAGATMRGAGDDTLSIVLLIAGAVLSTLGFGACGPWLLERLERVAPRLPVPGRIAFRDTARGRSRSSPIVTAILASVAAAIALGAWQASRDVENLKTWRPSLFADEIAIQGAGANSVRDVLVREPGVLRGAAVPSLLFQPGTFAVYELPDATDANGHRFNALDRCTNCNPGEFAAYQVSKASPATPDLLALAHAEGAATDLAAGNAVVLANGIASASTLEILVYSDPNSSDPTQRVTVPVRLIQVPVVSELVPQLFLPDPVIHELGLVESTPEQTAGEHGIDTLILQYDHAATDADVAHAQEVAARYPDTFASVDTPPGRQGELFRLLITALVLLFAVSVTGIAIALGEAESRPEQRTLLAVGADPRLRRRIAASRAAVLALLAGVLAVPAGLLPIWGIFASRGSPLALPTIEIAGAVLALPLLAVISAWLLSRPIPDWEAFRDVGSA
jgi:putative ABC transport system permease protein